MIVIPSLVSRTSRTLTWPGRFHGRQAEAAHGHFKYINRSAGHSCSHTAKLTKQWFADNKVVLLEAWPIKLRQILPTDRNGLTLWRA